VESEITFEFRTKGAEIMGDKIVKCKDCKFWDYVKGDSALCRRMPPTAVPMRVAEGVELTLVWPSTMKDDWCGEGRKA